MDLLDDEILNLWTLLDKHKVKLIMVGGFATNLHGFSRTTSDMDIWIKDSIENRTNFKIALQELGLGDLKEVLTMQFVAGWTTIKLNSGFELDIMTSLKGFEQESFDMCYEMAPTAIIQNIPIKFLHLNQLIEAKKQTARPKDLIDLIELERIKKEKE